ncbi:hypothetical protein PIROE2DRAFT_62725 [Piromyces sp. E2]|nr:hypothetical protein PIROE2DRAFT_62725 [Piromyces sp. E2]|eukprot:OUM61080.1 hypothetical protein PIROE2DRAFT_62725 [Piromyces sp. E2]
MSAYQENAFENLFHWAQAETRIMTKENPEITSLFRDALVILRQRQVLFQLCMDEIAQIRREAIVKSFIDALTIGGPEGIPRPIEFFAHDPLRYIGDMLAWIHQTLASEREMLQGLFDVRGKKMENDENLSTNPDGHNSQEFYEDAEKIFSIVPDNETIIELLNKILEGTCRPLQKDIMASYDTSLVSNNNKEAGFAEILSLLIDPIMQFVGLSSTNLNKYDSAIYMINSLTLLQSTLNQYSFTKKSAEKLNVEIGVYIDILIHEEYINILNQSGIEFIIHAAQTAKRDNVRVEPGIFEYIFHGLDNSPFGSICKT